MQLSRQPSQDNIESPSWINWFDMVFKVAKSLNSDGSINPAILSDDNAKTGSIYFSKEQNKLVFKDYDNNINIIY